MGDSRASNVVTFRHDLENVDLVDGSSKNEPYALENEISSPISSSPSNSNSLDCTDLVFYLLESNLESSRALFITPNDEERHDGVSDQISPKKNFSVCTDFSSSPREAEKNVESKQIFMQHKKPSDVPLSMVQAMPNDGNVPGYSPPQETPPNVVASLAGTKRHGEQEQHSTSEASDRRRFGLEPVNGGDIKHCTHVRVCGHDCLHVQSEDQGGPRAVPPKGEIAVSTKDTVHGRPVPWNTSFLAWPTQRHIASSSWSKMALSVTLGSVVCNTCYRPYTPDCSVSPPACTPSSSLLSSPSSSSCSSYLPFPSINSTTSSVSSFSSIALPVIDIHINGGVTIGGSRFLGTPNDTPRVSSRWLWDTYENPANSELMGCIRAPCNDVTETPNEEDTQYTREAHATQKTAEQVIGGGNIGHEGMSTEMLIQRFRHRARLRSPSTTHVTGLPKGDEDGKSCR